LPPADIFPLRIAAIESIAAMTARETCRIHLNDLGKRDASFAPT
jgi:hypothetical protein